LTKEEKNIKKRRGQKYGGHKKRGRNMEATKRRLKRPKYGGHERRPERSKHEGHEKKTGEAKL